MAGKPHIRVAAAVISRAGRYLLSRRRAGAHFAGYWEFPGGKIEPGETGPAALRRELIEELGVEIAEPRPLASLSHDEAERSVELFFFDASIRYGEPRALQVAEIGWFIPREMPPLPLLPADLPLVELLARRDTLRLRRAVEGGRHA